MVQRLGMAIVLVHDPEVFLLDEPASGLDPKSRMQLRDILKRLSADGKAVIISSHILGELSDFCTHVAIMDKGRMVVSGAVDEIQKKIMGTRKLVITLLDAGEQCANLIGTFAGARVVSALDNVIHAEVKDGLEQMAALNSFLVGKGVKVASFAAEKSNLEDLFVQITTDGE